MSSNPEQTQITSVRMGRNAPVTLMNTVETLSSVSGYENAFEFSKAIETSMYDNPGITHLLAGVGEAVSGKASLLLEIMRHNRRSGGKLEDRIGYQKYVGFQPWGDPFLILDDQVRGDPPLGVAWKDHSRIQVAASLPLFEEGLVSGIRGRYRPPLEGRLDYRSIYSESLYDPLKAIRCIGFDIPSNTGITYEGQEIGLPRAYDMMQQLIGHEGVFSNLEYKLFIFSITATQPVKNHGIIDRVVTAEARRTGKAREVARALKSRGKIVGQDLLIHAIEDAVPGNIEELEDDVNEVASFLHQQGLVENRFGLEIPTAETLNLHPNERPYIIGEAVNPWIFEQWGADKNQSAHFINGEVITNDDPRKRKVRFYREGVEWPFRKIHRDRFKQLGIL